MNYLILVTLYSLFQVFVPETLWQRAIEEVATLEAFGVFVTLLRGPKQEVHGCMGNWSLDLDPAQPQQLVHWVEQVTQSARFHDSRQFRFSKNMNEDVSTTVEVNVMLLPLTQVDVTSASSFSNQEYGLLVEGLGKRATYLPRVFPNSSLSDISHSLLEKAGLAGQDVENVTFYAYKTHVVTFNAYHWLTSARVSYFLQQEVAAFYAKYFESFIPYEFNSRTHQVSVHREEAVRNVSCLLDVLALSRRFPGTLDWKKTPLLQNLDVYFQKWFMYTEDLTQASIFLIRAYSLLFQEGVSHQQPNVQTRIAFLEDGLYNVLLTLEPQFAMGEAVSTLASLVNAGTPFDHVDKLLKACAFMKSRLETHTQSLTRFKRKGFSQLNLVFELNWQSQSAHKMLQLSLAQLPEQVPYFTAFIQELANTMLAIVSVVPAKVMETNYIAVIYECLCHLEAAMKLSGEHVSVALLEQKFKFYSTLLETRRGKWGLFYFNNSDVARLDLTGHTLLINL